MARLSQADVVETWESKKYPDRRYFVTKNRRVVLVKREAFASGKMMYYVEGSELPVNFKGIGRFAHIDSDPEVRKFLEAAAIKIV